MDPEQFLKVEMQALLPESDVELLIQDLKDSLEEVGFIPSRRAEGYAFLPMGNPVPTHLRLGVYGTTVTFWVRGALELEESAERLGMKPEEFSDALIKGLRRAEEVFRKFSDRGQVIVNWG